MKIKKLTKQQKIDVTKGASPYLIAFVISTVIGLILYKAKNIMPFGDQSILCMDLWGQYFPMYVQNAEADSIQDMLYSWNGAFGYNNWAQNAYYCNSIFWLIFKFLPVGKLVAALNWISLLKISFSSVSCLAFLKFKIKEKSPVLIAGAVSYSLCAYMLAFFSQCMWTDSLIYVPLLLIGLERMLRDKKPLMYTLMLALTIISSFYIGFAVCIFLVFYFICLAVPMINIYHNEESKIRIGGFKMLGGSILRFAIFSLLAGAISAAVIFPIGKAIGNTLASDMSAPSTISWYADMTAYLQQLLPGKPLSLGYSGANVATTILVFIMAPIYLFNNGIKISERIVNTLLICFLFASLNCNVLDYMWHGFHFPNQLPGRWSFLISLMLIYLCCAGVARIKQLHPIGAIIGLICGTALIVYVCKGHGTQPKSELDTKYIVILVISAILILAASVLAYIAKRSEKKINAAENLTAETPENAEVSEKNNNKKKESGKNKKNKENSDKNKKKTENPVDIPKLKKLVSIANTAALCCLTIVSAIQIYDSGSNFVNVSQREIEGMPTAEGVNYAKTVARNVEVAGEWTSGDDDFYRTISHSGFTFNPSMLGDSHGMGYYSSTMQGSVFELLHFLGNRVYAENVSTIYNPTSPVQNGLFGIKYVIDYNHNFGYYTPNSELVYESQEANIWENPTSLPIAYAVAESINDWHVTDEIRAIENQNNLLNAVCGRYVNAFTKLECTNFVYENITLQESPNWNTNYFITTDGSQPAVLNYTYTIPSDGDYYLEHNFRAGTIIATWDENEKDVPVGGERSDYLGKFSAGTVLSINVTVEDVSIGCCGLNVYSFDETAWQGAYDQLKNQQLNIEEFNTTSIKGSLHKESDGLVMATIAQDGGWKAYCDGEKLDTIVVADTFMAFEVPAGDHEIELKYSVPGLSVGIIVSLAGIIVLILLAFPDLWKKYLPKNNKNAS